MKTALSETALLTTAALLTGVSLTRGAKLLILESGRIAVMTIEIHQPELEALIQQRMESGAFQDVEEVLIYALKSAPPAEKTVQRQTATKDTLEEMFAKARGLLTEEEVDTLFRRDPSPGRLVNLS